MRTWTPRSLGSRLARSLLLHLRRRSSPTGRCAVRGRSKPAPPLLPHRGRHPVRGCSRQIRLVASFATPILSTFVRADPGRHPAIPTFLASNPHRQACRGDPFVPGLTSFFTGPPLYNPSSLAVTSCSTCR